MPPAEFIICRKIFSFAALKPKSFKLCSSGEGSSNLIVKLSASCDGMLATRISTPSNSIAPSSGKNAAEVSMCAKTFIREVSAPAKLSGNG